MSFDNCIESNRGCLWGKQVLSYDPKFITSHSQYPETIEIREDIQSTAELPPPIVPGHTISTVHTYSMIC